jgi:RimJ/RimL family protein N-acetyltransferase
MLYGEKIRLRANEKDDLPRYVRWLNDPDVLQGLDLFAPMSQVHEEQWFAEILKRPVEEQPMAVDLRVRGRWEHVGGIGFLNVDRRARSAEFGVHIGEKKYWDKGCGTDAVRTLVRYGFETLNLNRIWLRVMAYNKRAQRSYEKVGFQKEGMQREGYYYQGRYWDVFLYSILRREWDALQGGSKER